MTVEARSSGLPDVAISKLTPPVKNVFVVGQGLRELQARVANQGGSTSGTEAQIGFFLSEDAEITADDIRLGGGAVPPLAAGGTESLGVSGLQIPENQPSGDYFLGVLADDGNSVPETNELNNFGTTFVKVVASEAEIPVLESEFRDGSLLLEWSSGAVLQRSSDLLIWEDVNSAEHSFEVPLDGSGSSEPMFYRIRF